MLLRSVCATLCCCCVLACGGQGFHQRMTALVDRGAYAEAVSATRSQGREPKLEKALAEALLESAAQSPDAERRRRAFSELALAGTRSRPVLDRLFEAKQPLTRALAWSASLQLGGDDAREMLRELAGSSDPELSALGFEALEPVKDRQQLLLALTQPNRARRAAAVRVLQRSPVASEVRVALEEVAKHDPDPGVRAAAVTALARQGAEAAPAIERAADDEAQGVRTAALFALAAVLVECGPEPEAAERICDRDRIVTRLGRDLGSPPTPESLSAASAMLRIPNLSEPERARDVFTRALEAGDARLRGLAAVLCRALPAPGCSAGALRDRLRVEAAPEVKLLVALAIGPRDPLAHTALELLSNDGNSATAVEAAAELAAIGDVAAQQKLARALQHSDAGVRISVLRAFGRLSANGVLSETSATGEQVVDRLADRDERVRVAAAAAVLGFV
jgi:HEAT repeat protein